MLLSFSEWEMILFPLMGFTLNVTAWPALQVATFRHKSLADSLINGGETWQSGEAHQYYLLIQINESQLNWLKCVKDSTSYPQSIRTCDSSLTPTEDCSSDLSGWSHCANPETLTACFKKKKTYGTRCIRLSC